VNSFTTTNNSITRRGWFVVNRGDRLKGGRFDGGALELDRGRMKTLANPANKQEILQRLTRIGPASQRLWGRMTVTQMVCHLSDAFRVCIGEKEARSASNWFKRSVFKWIGLWAPAKWPPDVKTVPECDPELGGTAPTELERDLIELRGLLERFTEQPPKFKWQPHPMFGRMTDKEWMRWGYLHMDHHLRQFGA
jgi:hypothetical protein